MGTIAPQLPAGGRFAPPAPNSTGLQHFRASRLGELGLGLPLWSPATSFLIGCFNTNGCR